MCPILDLVLRDSFATAFAAATVMVIFAQKTSSSNVERQQGRRSVSMHFAQEGSSLSLSSAKKCISWREKQFYVTIFSRAKMDLDIARNRTSFGYCSSKWNVHMRNNNIHLQNMRKNCTLPLKIQNFRTFSCLATPKHRRVDIH